MIIETTINGTVQYIDTDIILYGYDNSGLELIANVKASADNPSADVFESNSLQVASLPTYADFVTATSRANFVVIDTLCVNASRVKGLYVIDASNTTIMFERGVTVDVVEPIASVMSALIPSAPSSPGRTKSVDITSDGTGVITLPDTYITDSWDVSLRGLLVRRAVISETGANELTISPTTPTKIGDFINVKYRY